MYIITGLHGSHEYFLEGIILSEIKVNVYEGLHILKGRTTVISLCYFLHHSWNNQYTNSDEYVKKIIMIVIKMIILIIKIFLIIVVISIMLISKQNIVLNVKLGYS